MPPKRLSCTLTIFALFAAILLSGCTKSDTSTPSTASQPLITGVTPTEVKAGAMITITGSGFGDNKGTSVLTIGGAAAVSILSWSDSEIKAIVPEDALTGTVKATVQNKDSDERHLVVLWDNENPQNVAIPGNYTSPLFTQLIADGSGGAILVWNDYRNFNYDPLFTGPQQINIYAQQLNSRGKITWSSFGVPLSTIAGGQYFPQLVSDGDGGAIVVWQDYRSGSQYDIYAQRISRSGALVWASDVAVCVAVKDQEKPKIVSDGAGGVIIVWQDYRSSSQYEVYAQRIDGNGVPQWTADGAAISTTSNNPQFLFPEIVSDGSGGAIIVWQDYRSSTWYLYAQRIDNAGIVKWTADGVPVSTIAASYQYVPRPVADGFGGAIIAWKSSGGDIYAQRFDGSGAQKWGSAGTVISAALDDQTAPQMTTDGNGGAIITWEDCRVGSANRDIYAQRVNASGTVQWTTDGVPVCTAAYSQHEPQITSDDKGGAIITWYDYRNYYIMNNGILEGVDTFAQRLSSDGTALWTTDGEAISTADLHQMYPKIASDDSGGAIILWEDERTGTAVDLYAQGISTSGKQ